MFFNRLLTALCGFMILDIFLTILFTDSISFVIFMNSASLIFFEALVLSSVSFFMTFNSSNFSNNLFSFWKILLIDSLSNIFSSIARRPKIYLRAGLAIFSIDSR